MTTGQTILAMGALVLMTTIMLNFYRVFSGNWDTLDSSQMGIDATTIATSYMEIAHGLSFDRKVLYEDVVVQDPATDLTFPTDFGPPDSVQYVSDFTVFDYFDGVSDTTTIPGLGTYVAEFDVYYVQPNDVHQISNNQTFLKRMDIEIWRIEPPPPPGSGVDRVSMWTVMGYFTFN